MSKKILVVEDEKNIDGAQLEVRTVLHPIA